MSEFDHAFFKCLTNTDIGATGSNEGGPVIPVGLTAFLPPLRLGSVVEDWLLVVDLFIGDVPVGQFDARWHYQTRGGTRTPEYRITRNFVTGFLDQAQEDDMLVFERYVDSADRYRITLVQQSSADYGVRRAAARYYPRSSQQKEFGDFGTSPQSLEVIARERRRLARLTKIPFSVVAQRARRQTSVWARESAFSKEVRSIYEYRCTACDLALTTPPKTENPRPTDRARDWETEAAHIIPVALKGPDDIRNGICLCRTHHWAFDRFLIYIDAMKNWQVSPGALRGWANAENQSLLQVVGRSVRPPTDPRFRPEPTAIAWHRDRALVV